MVLQDVKRKRSKTIISITREVVREARKAFDKFDMEVAFKQIKKGVFLF